MQGWKVISRRIVKIPHGVQIALIDRVVWSEGWMKAGVVGIKDRSGASVKARGTIEIQHAARIVRIGRGRWHGVETHAGVVSINSRCEARESARRIIGSPLLVHNPRGRSARAVEVVGSPLVVHNPLGGSIRSPGRTVGGDICIRLLVHGAGRRIGRKAESNIPAGLDINDGDVGCDHERERPVLGGLESTAGEGDVDLHGEGELGRDRAAGRSIRDPGSLSWAVWGEGDWVGAPGRVGGSEGISERSLALTV